MNAIDTLPLAGIRVVEFSHMVMGPTCGMILADLGAEVIKVEPPDGDKTRRLPGLGMGFFRTFNRNKKSLVLDLGKESDLAAAKKLISTADVMLENFRPGQMARLGLDYQSVKRLNPKLIYAAHKGFLSGPYEHRLALDEVVQMMGGLAYMTGLPGRPLRAGASVNDIMGGMFGALGILAALHERTRTGVGQEVQSALYENCALLSSQHMQQFQMSGVPLEPMPSRASAWGVYDVFTLAGGRQLFVAAVSDKQWLTLCDLLERPDLRDDPDLRTNAMRVACRPRLLERLGAIMREQDYDLLIQKLDKADLPYAPIQRPDQLLEDPHLIESGGLVDMQVEDGSVSKAVLLPLMMNGRRLGVQRPIPAVGEHSDEILRALG